MENRESAPLGNASGSVACLGKWRQFSRTALLGCAEEWGQRVHNTQGQGY